MKPTTDNADPVVRILMVAALFFVVAIRSAAEEPASATGALLSESAVVAPPTDDPGRPWRLKWASTERTYNEAHLFVTVHERSHRHEVAGVGGMETDRQSRAVVYLVQGEQFKVLQRLETPEFDVSQFLQPVVGWAKVHGEKNEREQLIQITELFFGTGVFRTEHIYRVKVVPHKTLTGIPEVALEPVELMLADKSVAPRLPSGEANWNGVETTFASGEFSFHFFLWHEKDGNCCPTAGVISGTYKVERIPDHPLRISMDQFERSPLRQVD